MVDSVELGVVGTGAPVSGMDPAALLRAPYWVSLGSVGPCTGRVGPWLTVGLVRLCAPLVVSCPVWLMKFPWNRERDVVEFAVRKDSLFRGFRSRLSHHRLGFDRGG